MTNRVPFETDGRTFTFLRASDVDRDGVAFEAWEGDEQVAETFYSDATGKITFTAFKWDLPVELVIYLTTDGLEQITPTNGG